MVQQTAGGAENRAEVTLLGRFSIQSQRGVFDDSDNRSLKMWSILAYIIIHRNRPIPKEELLEIFWKGERSANPGNALKTILFRTREAMVAVFGDQVNPFVARRGSYQWNPELICRVDVEEFEALCHRADDESLPKDERLALYAQVLPRYKAGFLPQLRRRSWADKMSGRYHDCYLGGVARCADLLDKAGRHEEMEALCRSCVELDPLNEKSGILLVRALLCQGKNLEALEQYSRSTDLRYRELGDGPSPAMQALYTEIMRMERGLEMDLGAIQGDLRETEERPGTFYCEYGLFREIYRLEARRATRGGDEVFIGLITLTDLEGKTPNMKAVNAAMQKLRVAAEANLRRGDVMARYSVAQLVFLLPGADRETSYMALERVVTAYQRQSRRNALKLTCRTRAVEPE